jgi:hypothetical protein
MRLSDTRKSKLIENGVPEKIAQEYFDWFIQKITERVFSVEEYEKGEKYFLELFFNEKK